MRFLFNNYKLVRRLIHIISAVVFIASCPFTIWLYQHGYLTNQAKLQTLVGQDKFLGALFFTLLQMMQVVVPIVPISLTMVLVVMTFHPAVGILPSCIGTILGSTILFLLTRWYGERFCLLFVKEETFKKYEKLAATHKFFTIIFILYMISPSAPADLFVILAAPSNMPFKTFSKIIILCKPISIIGHVLILIYGGEWAPHFL